MSSHKHKNSDTKVPGYDQLAPDIEEETLAGSMQKLIEKEGSFSELTGKCAME